MVEKEQDARGKFADWQTLDYTEASHAWKEMRAHLDKMRTALLADKKTEEAQRAWMTPRACGSVEQSLVFKYCPFASSHPDWRPVFVNSGGCQHRRCGPWQEPGRQSDEILDSPAAPPKTIRRWVDGVQVTEHLAGGKKIWMWKIFYLG